MAQRLSMRISAGGTGLLAAALVFAGMLALPTDSRGAIPQDDAGGGPQIPRDDTRKSKEATESYKAGLRAEHTQDWVAAFHAYAQAAELAPDNHQYALHREKARTNAVQAKMDAAERDAISGRLEEARKEMNAAHLL